MRNRTIRMAVVGALAVVVAVWVAAAFAPTARADKGGGEVRRFAIPASATAILRWTFEKAPATAIKASFQISRDKKHWRTLKVVKIAKGTKRVRTSWKAPARAEIRFFRLNTANVRSDLVRLRVK